MLGSYPVSSLPVSGLSAARPAPPSRVIGLVGGYAPSRPEADTFTPARPVTGRVAAISLAGALARHALNGRAGTHAVAGAVAAHGAAGEAAGHALAGSYAGGRSLTGVYEPADADADTFAPQKPVTGEPRTTKRVTGG